MRGFATRIRIFLAETQLFPAMIAVAALAFSGGKKGVGFREREVARPRVVGLGEGPKHGGTVAHDFAGEVLRDFSNGKRHI